MTQHSLARALLHAETVALVGASSDPTKNTARPQRFLKSHGFNGTIVPINPNRKKVQGLTSYPNLREVPIQVDHAFIMAPSKDVPTVITDCAEAKVRLATIYTNGFAETGSKGADLQAEVSRIAQEGNVRLIGPNSMGIIDTRSRLTLTINAFLERAELKTGHIGLISQSGTVMGTMMSRGAARGIGFSSLISIGNECDVSVGEIVGLMVDDPGTKVIILFLEAIRDAELLAVNARRAFEVGKPVIAYKLGRSEVGRELALTHSGAIAGPDASANAFFHHNGILRVDMLETLLELPPLIVQKKPTVARRVAVLTTTGGGAAMVVDRLGAVGLDLVSASSALRSRMAEFNLDLGNGRVIDLTMAGTRTGVYGAALEILLNEPNTDAVVAVVGTSAQFHPEVAVKPIINAPKTKKPLAVFMAPQADESLLLLQQAGIAAFRTPEACADGVRALIDWHAPKTVPKPKQLNSVARLIEQFEGNTLNEIDSANIFAELGIPIAPSTIVSGPTAILELDLTFPVSAKVISADISHKTEAGAVALNIPDLSTLRTKANAIWKSAQRYKPDARLDGILIQTMVLGLVEVLLGFRRDPGTGPVVILSVGGVLAEIYDDVAVRSAPIDLPTAYEMIKQVRGLSSIRGYRNQPKGDLRSLANSIKAISNLAAIKNPSVLEAEINPLSVDKEGFGVLAVDALIRLAP